MDIPWSPSDPAHASTCQNLEFKTASPMTSLPSIPPAGLVPLALLLSLTLTLFIIPAEAAVRLPHEPHFRASCDCGGDLRKVLQIMMQDSDAQLANKFRIEIKQREAKEREKKQKEKRMEAKEKKNEGHSDPGILSGDSENSDDSGPDESGSEYQETSDLDELDSEDSENTLDYHIGGHANEDYRSPRSMLWYRYQAMQPFIVNVIEYFDADFCFQNYASKFHGAEGKQLYSDEHFDLEFDDDGVLGGWVDPKKGISDKKGGAAESKSRRGNSDPDVTAIADATREDEPDGLPPVDPDQPGFSLRGAHRNFTDFRLSELVNETRDRQSLRQTTRATAKAPENSASLKKSLPDGSLQNPFANPFAPLQAYARRTKLPKFLWAEQLPTLFETTFKNVQVFKRLLAKALVNLKQLKPGEAPKMKDRPMSVRDVLGSIIKKGKSEGHYDDSPKETDSGSGANKNESDFQKESDLQFQKSPALDFIANPILFNRKLIVDKTPVGRKAEAELSWFRRDGPKERREWLKSNVLVKESSEISAKQTSVQKIRNSFHPNSPLMTALRKKRRWEGSAGKQIWARNEFEGWIRRTAARKRMAKRRHERETVANVRENKNKIIKTTDESDSVEPQEAEKDLTIADLLSEIVEDEHKLGFERLLAEEGFVGAEKHDDPNAPSETEENKVFTKDCEQARAGEESKLNNVDTKVTKSDPVSKESESEVNTDPLSKSDCKSVSKQKAHRMRSHLQTPHQMSKIVGIINRQRLFQKPRDMPRFQSFLHEQHGTCLPLEALRGFFCLQTMTEESYPTNILIQNKRDDH